MPKYFPIYEKHGWQIRVKSSFLWMFTGCFIVWQIGVLFYSGTTMSLWGRTPVPLGGEDTTLIIGAGYIAAIIFLCLFPRRVVYAERIILPIAWAATALMLLPFSPQVLTVLFYIGILGCVFSIGGMASLAAHLFTVDTTWRDAIIGLATGGVLIAILQNDLVEISSTIFIVLSLVMIAALTLFHFLIPAKIEVPYAGRANAVKMPKILFGGTWMLNAFSTLLLCLASSFAESFTHGVSLLYLSGAALAGLAGYLKKRYGSYSLKLFGVYFMLTVAGFVLAAFSLQVPSIRPLAGILLGLVVVLANGWIFFCAVAFKFYPTRFIGAMGAGQGLILALIHSGLLEAFREDTALLYGLYAALAMGMMLCYYFLEPYFTYAWKRAQKAPAAAGVGAEVVSAHAVNIAASTDADKKTASAEAAKEAASAEAAKEAVAAEAGAEVVSAPAVNIAASTDAGKKTSSADAAKEAVSAEAGVVSAPAVNIAASTDAGKKTASAEAGKEAASVDAAKKTEPFARLSEQERILAELILRGYTESVIAREMNITLNTQKSYRKNLYAKLDIHSKRELFELASR